MQRRKFIQICVAGSSANAACLAAQAHANSPASPVKAGGPATPVTETPLAEKRYARVKLVDPDGKAIKGASLKANHNYVFHYPFASTPCFLLKLDKAAAAKSPLKSEAGGLYASVGGVGGQKSIVAYSAICAHKMAYPTKQVSFISYRADARVGSAATTRAKVIACCADKSVYDPAQGARVVSGPAPQPLATILLEHDAKTDELYAVGTLGGEKFDAFFEKYEFKLSLEMGARARERVTGTVTLSDLTAFSSQTARC
ncbi:MAG: (2Fe-2S)-binding protein [Betaproteobacteria bacterium]|nr:(2Fe-2S)-binding protein [Betaproteobacteria bacterium]